MHTKKSSRETSGQQQRREAKKARRKRRLKKRMDWLKKKLRPLLQMNSEMRAEIKLLKRALDGRD